MLFVSRHGEEYLIDMGCRLQKLVCSSYLGKLDALVWACERTKGLRGTIPEVVRTDNQAPVDKWRSRSVYDSEIRVFRRWVWLVENEPEIRFEFVPGSESTGADLLSRLFAGKGQVDIPPSSPRVNQISVWDEIRR